MDAPETCRVAVIGSGISGLSAAWFATQAGAHVVLYESDERLGGHADTHLVADGVQELAIDTGFIVHNRRTYPVLCRLFDELGVQTQPSEMSLSVHDVATGLEWAGAKGPRGLFPEPRRVLDVGHWRMVAEIPRFHRVARRLLATPLEAGDPTLDEFLDQHRFSGRLRRHFVRALVAAVWSCDPEVAGQYPARHLFTFLANHGMLSVFGSPQWRTVVGGSHEYVRRIAKEIPDIRLATAVTGVEEDTGGVTVLDADGGEERFDHVIVATHPRQGLTLLSAPTPEQQEVLAAMPYSPNPALLHTDDRLLPRADGARAAWNLRLPSSPEGRVTVTYDMTRLQRLPTEKRYLVTLGGEDLVDPATIIARMDYEHPVYTAETVAAQRRLPEIDTPRIVFAGAHHGWGFHEDGARSGAEAVRRLGLAVPAAASPAAPAPEVFRTRVGHCRTQPFRRTFEQRSATWVVDIDQQATRQERQSFWRRATGGTIEARDHLGDPTATLRQNLAAFLARHGIELGDASVRLMAHPRAFGFCFNPISVWWCTRRDGTPLATVVEVHNTYGDRHAYLFDGGTETEHRVDKAMYVSPFHGVVGSYRVTAPRPTDVLDLRVDLDLPEGATFHASIRGRRTSRLRWRAATAGMVDRLAITAHGLALWTRRLPIQPRPMHHQEGVR